MRATWWSRHPSLTPSGRSLSQRLLKVNRGYTIPSLRRWKIGPEGSTGARGHGEGGWGDLVVSGIGGRYNIGEELFDLGNSGTGLNLFMAAASLGAKLRRFDGDASLRSRPFRPLLLALEKLGASFSLTPPQRRTSPSPYAGRFGAPG